MDLIHLSFNRHLPRLLKPRLPPGYSPKVKKTDMEELDTPRVSFSTTLLGAVKAIYPNVKDVFDNAPDGGWVTIHVYKALVKNQRLVFTKSLIDDRLVWDAHLTDEVWSLDPIKVEYVETIEVKLCGKLIEAKPFNDDSYTGTVRLVPSAIKVRNPRSKIAKAIDAPYSNNW